MFLIRRPECLRLSSILSVAMLLMALCGQSAQSQTSSPSSPFDVNNDPTQELAPFSSPTGIPGHVDENRPYSVDPRAPYNRQRTPLPSVVDEGQYVRFAP